MSPLFVTRNAGKRVRRLERIVPLWLQRLRWKAWESKVIDVVCGPSEGYFRVISYPEPHKPRVKR